MRAHSREAARKRTVIAREAFGAAMTAVGKRGTAGMAIASPPCIGGIEACATHTGLSRQAGARPTKECATKLHAPPCLSPRAIAPDESRWLPRRAQPRHKMRRRLRPAERHGAHGWTCVA